MAEECTLVAAVMYLCKVGEFVRVSRCHIIAGVNCWWLSAVVYVCSGIKWA
jgi:hypothetical protein